MKYIFLIQFLLDSSKGVVNSFNVAYFCGMKIYKKIFQPRLLPVHGISFVLYFFYRELKKSSFSYSPLLMSSLVQYLRILFFFFVVVALFFLSTLYSSRLPVGTRTAHTFPFSSAHLLMKKNERTRKESKDNEEKRKRCKTENKTEKQNQGNETKQKPVKKKAIRKK